MTDGADSGPAWPLPGVGVLRCVVFISGGGMLLVITCFAVHSVLKNKRWGR